MIQLRDLKLFKNLLDIAAVLIIAVVVLVFVNTAIIPDILAGNGVELSNLLFDEYANAFLTLVLSTVHMYAYDALFAGQDERSLRSVLRQKISPPRLGAGLLVVYYTVFLLGVTAVVDLIGMVYALQAFYLTITLMTLSMVEFHNQSLLQINRILLVLQTAAVLGLLVFIPELGYPTAMVWMVFVTAAVGIVAYILIKVDAQDAELSSFNRYLDDFAGVKSETKIFHVELALKLARWKSMVNATFPALAIVAAVAFFYWMDALGNFIDGGSIISLLASLFGLAGIGAALVTLRWLLRLRNEFSTEMADLALELEKFEGMNERFLALIGED